MATGTINCKDYLVAKSLNCGSYSLSAYGNAIKTIDASSAVPSGYIRRYVYGYYSGDANVFFYYVAASDETHIQVGLQSISGSAKTVTPSVIVVSTRE